MAKALFKAFNLGRDMELQISIDHLMNTLIAATPASPNAVPVFDIGELGLLKSFKCDPVYESIVVDAINLGGGATSRDEYKHDEGRIVIVRQSAASDWLMNALQNACLAGSGQITCTISQFIYDSRGPAAGVVKHTWAEATLKPESRGEWASNTPVEQSFIFTAPKGDLEDVTGGVPTTTGATLALLGKALKIIQ